MQTRALNRAFVSSRDTFDGQRESRGGRERRGREKTWKDPNDERIEREQGNRSEDRRR